MSKLKDIFDSDITKGVAIGAGLVLVAPLIYPKLNKAGKPTKKALVRLGHVVYEKLTEASAELVEIVEDAVAETSAEFEASSRNEEAAMDNNPPAEETDPVSVFGQELNSSSDP